VTTSIIFNISIHSNKGLLLLAITEHDRYRIQDSYRPSQSRSLSNRAYNPQHEVTQWQA